MSRVLSTLLLAISPAVVVCEPLESRSCPATGCASKDTSLFQMTRHLDLGLSANEQRDVHNRALAASADVTIVSYNLYWWNVKQNNRWSQLYDRIRSQGVFGLIGFQECEDVRAVLVGSGLEKFDYYQGPNKPSNNPAPLAWNTDVFSKVGGPSEKWIASDQYGGRYMTWVRLNHISSGVKIFFANTHGPLGNCGSTVGNNLAAGITENKVTGDVVFITGDFNCGASTTAMVILKNSLVNDKVNDIDGGIDHVVTDFGQKLSGGSVNGWPSDHPLLKATFRASNSTTSPTSAPTPRPTSVGASTPAKTCSDAVVGDSCHIAVTWAMTTGLSSNPEWYPGLSNQSSFKAFQRVLHTGGHGGCGLPCYECAPFSEWPSVDEGVTCGGCTALVLTSPYSGSCNTYCQSFGHVCLAAAEEVDETCDAEYSVACDTQITGTSDMLCTCGKAASLIE